MAGVFFMPDLSDSDPEILLTGDEAHHAVTVRRVRPGEAVAVTNGAGLLCEGEVREIHVRPPRLAIKKIACRRLPRIDLHLVAALPKGDRQRHMLDMATQAGMTRFTPLECERSASKEGKNTSERWRRIVMESMKQSRRAWLPEVNPLTRLPELLDSLEGCSILLASADGKLPVEIQLPESTVGTVVLVGPEGGFTGPELKIIQQAGAIPVRLADAVLRTETAAVTGVAAAAAIIHAQGR